ncbi:unnamed protein product [Closterium sp. NIES-54]
MALLRVLAFDHEGRPVQFDTWLDDLQLYLLSDSKDSVSLFDPASGAATAPPAIADNSTRSQWLTRDAAARSAIRNHLPLAECAHFGQHRTAQALYDAVVTRYSSPATAALGRLLLPNLFLELSAFTTVEDLVSHLHSSDAHFHAAVPAEDHFLSLDPTSLTVDLLKQHLLAAETSAVAVGAARGTSRPLFFEGCSPSPLAPSYASAAAADVSVPEDVRAAYASAKRCSGKGKGGRGGGGGSGGGGGGRRVVVRAAVEVVAAVGLLAGVGALVAVVEAALEVAAVEAVGLVAVGLALGVWVLGVANVNRNCVGARPRLPSSFTCGRPHTQHRCFSHLNDAWRAKFGDDVELPHWADLLKSRIAIFDLDLDAILSAMYALSVSAEGDSYRCVPLDPGLGHLPIVSRLLATAVTDPSFDSAAASALIAELLDFDAACRLDYATALVAESMSASPPSVGCECSLGTDVLEDRQEDFECLAAAVPCFASMLLAPEGDPDSPDIPTPHSYAKAITGPYFSQVKRPPGSPPAFKARYVARGFSQRQGVDYFQTFSPTPKMTTLQVLLHVAAQRDTSCTLWTSAQRSCRAACTRRSGCAAHLVSLSLFLQVLTGVFGGQSTVSARRLASDTTHAALGFAPATSDPSLFLHTDTSLPPFYVLLYVDDLVFATADIEALTFVKSKLQKRHTCTDLGELRSYLGWQITRDRARRTITLTQSHMVQQCLLAGDIAYTALGKLGDASVFRVWGSRAFVRDTTADKLSARAIPCAFLGLPPDAPGWQFYHPTSHRVLPSEDVMFEESVPFYLSTTLPRSRSPFDLGAAQGSASGGAASGGAEPAHEEPGVVEPEGAGPGGAGPGGAEHEGAEPGGADSEGAESGGAELARTEPAGTLSTGGPPGALSRRETLSPPQLRKLFARGTPLRSGAAGARGSAIGGIGAGAAGRTGAAGHGGAHTGGNGAAGAGGAAGVGVGCFGVVATRAAGAGGAAGVGARDTGAGGSGRGGVGDGYGDTGPPSDSSLPHLPLPSPPASSLADGPDPESDLVCAASSTVPRLLATVVTDPSFESAATLALVAELVDFAAACCLDYAAILLAESEFDCPLCLPHLVSMLIAAEGDPEAPDIPTPRSYAEAITDPYSSQWQTAMDAEMASWNFTGTYVDALPPPGANIVDGMWIFRVKRPPGSPPAFMARYVARGFS